MIAIYLFFGFLWICFLVQEILFGNPVGRACDAFLHLPLLGPIVAILGALFLLRSILWGIWTFLCVCGKALRRLARL